MRRVAVCDLGSNSFRLVVFTAEEGRWKRTDEIYEPVRIGAGLAETGKLGRKGIERGLATVEVFQHFCQASGLEEIDAVATSAIRDATNADEFLSRAALPVRVLSKEEEAHFGYVAAVNSTTLADGAVLDLGGGSLQLTRVVSRHPREMESWRLGAVRMTERFELGDGPASKKQLRALREHAAAKLESAPWLERAGRRLVGIGGTVRNLAAAAQRAAELPEFGVQGYVIERAALDDLIARLASLPPADRPKRVPGIKPSRADLILAGAVVIQTVLEVGGFEAIEATEAGLREGVFFARHLEGDPPLFDDVRRSTVLNLEAHYPVEPPGHVEHVARLALGLFDALAEAGLHEGDKRERELVWAAACLHDIGVTVDYDDHHKHSRYLIFNASLPGFSQREVALIGQAVRYHRKGMPSLGPFTGLTDKGDTDRLTRMATLLRLAEDLERSRDRAVRETRLSVNGSTVMIELVADEDVRVARWAAGRETELFRRAYGRDLTIV